MYKKINRPCGPINQYSYFVGPNPRTSLLPVCYIPVIDETVFIGPFSSIIGNVVVDANTFIACNVSIRADEGSPFYIGDNTNIQDGVILHGLKNQYVEVLGKKYSIFIGKRVCCAHGCIIHGPCFVGNETFVGVKAIVFNATIGSKCYIGTGAVVTNGVVVADNKYVPLGSVIDTQEKANQLGAVPSSQEEFAKGIVAVNIEYPYSYSLLFGSERCSCGLCCEGNSYKSKRY